MGTSKTRRLAWVLVLCGLGTATAQMTGKTVRHHKEAVQDDSQSTALVQAEAAIGKHDYAGAEALLKQIVDKDSSSYQAWFDLGFVYNALGKSDESIAAYRKSVQAKPGVFESNLNLGLMLARHGDAEAERYLAAATKLTPTDHPTEGLERAWLSLGHVLERHNQQGALAAYRQAAAVQPQDPEPHISAGLLLERQNDLPAAEKEYQEVLGLDPQSVEAATALTNIYMRSKKLPEAASMLHRLADQRPEDAGIHLQLARVLAAQGHTDEAIAELQSTLKLTPNDREAQSALADLYTSTKKYGESDPIYRSLLAGKPDDAELHQSLGHVLMEQRKFPEAQQEFLEDIKLRPNLGSAYGDLAAAANENQNYELAIKALDARAKLIPEIPVSYFLRATAYDHLRNYKEAAANYHLFLQAANGKYPDQEWQARHRLVAIEPKK